MANKVQIVGGERSGEYIKWFGNRVHIQGIEHQLHRAWFKDGTNREYYVAPGMNLVSMMDEPTLHRIEVVG